MEHIKNKQEKIPNKINKLKEKTNFSIFLILVKWEFFLKKASSKKYYIRLKNIWFHVSKTELKETYQMIKLLLKKNRTENENKFIQEQLWDLARMWVLWTSGIAPWWFIILAIFHKFWIDLKPSALKEFEDKK